MVVVGKEAYFWGWDRSEVVDFAQELGQWFLDFCGDIVFVPGLMVAVDDVFQFEILTAGAFESLPLSVLFSPTLQEGVGLYFKDVDGVSLDQCLQLRDVIKGFILVVVAVAA